MRLPHFPLHVVLFPHLPLPLQIFEERYRTMVRDVLADGSPYAGRFLISMITDGSELATDDGRAPSTARIGTIAEIRHAQHFADGRWSLLTVGTARAEVGSLESDGRYMVAEMTELPELAGDAAAASALLPEVQAALDAYLATVKRYVASAASIGRVDNPETDLATSLDQLLKPVRLPEDPLAASYAVGGMLQVELTRKQQLLELPDAVARLSAELRLLRREARLLADGAMSPIGTADLHYNRN